MSVANVLVGFVFVIILTRSLSPMEFGTWALITSFTYYVILIEPIISYWTTRDIARGIESGKTAIISSGIFSIIAVLIYVAISYFVGHQTNVDTKILFFASMLVPIIFVNKTLTAINLGWKPHASSYAGFFFVIAEVILALVFVYFLHMGLFGVILTVTIAYLTSIILLLSYAKDKIKNNFKSEFLKKWIRLSWLPLYRPITLTIWALDVIIFLVIAGLVTGLGFWNAAATSVVLVTLAINISQAVYPKLLGSQNREYLHANVSHLFYFLILFTAITITFAKPVLFVLNPVYITMVQVVAFMAIWRFFDVLNLAFESFLIGIENVDLDEKATFKNYVKSKLFFVPTLFLIRSISYISLLIVGFLILKTTTNSELDFLIYWSIVGLVTQIPITVYLYLLMKRNFALKLDFNAISKYILVAIGVFGLLFILGEQFFNYEKNIFEFLPGLLLFLCGGIGIYLIITCFVDSGTRKLFSAIIREIRKV